MRDILAAYPDAIIIPSSSRYKGKTHDVSHHDNNGVVLLYYAIISKTSTTYEMKFDYKFAQKIKKVKENTIKKVLIIMAAQDCIILLEIKEHMKW